MGFIEWVGWIGLALVVYYLYERIQEFEDIMPPEGIRHTEDTSISRKGNATSVYRHVMRHAKHEDSSSKGIYKWLLGKFKIQTATHLDEKQYRDSLTAITTGNGYGNHGSFALPGSNHQSTDRAYEHATFDDLVKISQGDVGHIEIANLDVDAENSRRIEKQTTLLDEFTVSTLHSVEKFHSDADTLKPHIEKPEEDKRRMNVTIIDNSSNDNKRVDIKVVRIRRSRRRMLRGER